MKFLFYFIWKDGRIGQAGQAEQARKNVGQDSREHN
jgi:hypothetical protein